MIWVFIALQLCGCSWDFSFQALPASSPVVESFSPSILSASGGDTLSVTGENFRTGDQIYLNETACPNSVVQSETSISCTTPTQSQVTALSVKVVRGNITTESSQKLLIGMTLGGSASAGTEMFTKNLSGVVGIKQIAGKIYFSNYAQYKLSILNSSPTQNYPTFDATLGQASMTAMTMTGYSFNQYYSFGSYDFDSDGTHLIVADYVQHRILIWNSLPKTATQPADVVLGHSSWLAQAANDGNTTSTASGLNLPRGVKISGGKLFVADTSNNRVLIWNSIPTSNNTAADVVLGQPDFVTNTANSGGISSTSLSSPYSVEVVGTKLVVADQGNNRVLIWNTIPTLTQTPADIVLGQSLFTTNTANNGGVSAKSLRSPNGVYSDGTKLYVADSTNNRVLIWNTIPTTSFALADVVVGQSSMTTSSAGVSDTAYSAPTRMTVIDGNLVVSDTGNNRALFYTGVPTSSGASATYVVGQPSFTDNLSRNPNKPLGMVSVTGVTTDGTRLVGVDTGKHRVLIWNSLPTSSDQVPDVILGQSDLNTYTKSTTVSASSLNGPRGAVIVGDKLYVTDSGNNRILIWNTWPTTNNQAADAVLGQSSLTASTKWAGGTISGSSFYSPYGITTDGTHLMVADYGDNRVMIWNTVPTANGVAADVIVGQPDAVSSTANNGGVSAATLYNPYSARIFNSKLFIADKNNQRLLIFNSVPSTNGASADVVLGQADMTSNTLNRGTGAISANTLTAPMDMCVDGNKLYILEDVANRISVFNSVPTTNGVAADSAIGLTNLTTYSPAQARGLGWPNSMMFTTDKIFIADYINGRLLILPKN